MNDLQAFVDERAQGEAAASLLRTTPVVRERCGQLLERLRAGGSNWFELDDTALGDAARQVATCARRRHPGLRFPLFSLWRHLEAGGVDRRAELERLLAPAPVDQRTHTRIDLALVAQFLAGEPGRDWSYTEPATGRVLAGQEGLAVASFHAFTTGLFSGDPQQPLQADALGLRGLVCDHLARALQVHEANPLPGLEARAIGLRRLGEVLSGQPEVFGDEGRPAGVFDIIVSPYGHGVPHTADVQAHDILSQLLVTLSGLTAGGPSLGGIPLGDCWRHPAVRGAGSSDGWVPLHARMQGLAYSLLEPFAWAGVQVRGLPALTAPADPVCGGLLIDTGALRLKDPRVAQDTWAPGDELIVEWRALTVALLERLASAVREQLGLSEEALPMGCLLQAGIEPVGRALAAQLREGRPSLQVREPSGPM